MEQLTSTGFETLPTFALPTFALPTFTSHIYTH